MVRANTGLYYVPKGECNASNGKICKGSHEKGEDVSFRSVYFTKH